MCSLYWPLKFIVNANGAELTTRAVLYIIPAGVRRASRARGSAVSTRRRSVALSGSALRSGYGARTCSSSRISSVEPYHTGPAVPALYTRVDRAYAELYSAEHDLNRVHPESLLHRPGIRNTRNRVCTDSRECRSLMGVCRATYVCHGVYIPYRARAWQPSDGTIFTGSRSPWHAKHTPPSDGSH